MWIEWIRKTRSILCNVSDALLLMNQHERHKLNNVLNRGKNTIISSVRDHKLVSTNRRIESASGSGSTSSAKVALNYGMKHIIKIQARLSFNEYNNLLKRHGE